MTDQSGDNISSNLLISSMLKEGSVLLNKQFKLTRSFNIVATSYQLQKTVMLEYNAWCNERSA